MFSGIKTPECHTCRRRRLNLLGLEPAAETGAVKGSTEDNGFIDIHVDRNLAFLVVIFMTC